MTTTTLPVYLRIGDSEPHQVGTVDLDLTADSVAAADDLTGLGEQLLTEVRASLTRLADRPLGVGDTLHGYCNGIFGRDHYTCCTIEDTGPDWIVARDHRGELSFAQVDLALTPLRQHRQRTADYDGNYCCSPDGGRDAD